MVGPDDAAHGGHGMATTGTRTIVQHLRKIVRRIDGPEISDGQLLEAFVTDRDAAAFESLVQRHGPMVLGVCRRVLRDPHDAEDAFQATFLVLARKAASVSPREMVGNWLYGVAHTTAVRARAANAKRRQRERQVLEMPEPQALREEPHDDLQQLLDEELARLPDKHRVPIVLCDLEGRPRREVARQLKIPEGTLSSRLTTARRTLAKRLTRRGLALSGGALAMAMSHEAASAGVPALLVRATVQAAILAAAGQTTAGLISVQVAALTQGVLNSMFVTKLKSITLLLVIAVLSVGAGLVYTTQAAETPGNGTAKPSPKQVAERPKARQGNTTSNRPRAKTKDEEVIQGVWMPIGFEDDSKSVVFDECSIRLFVTNEFWICKNGDEDRLFSYKIRPEQSPKQVDLTARSNAGDVAKHVISGIYEIDGDTLRVCESDGRRPTKFSTRDGAKNRLLTYRRCYTRVYENKGDEQGKQIKPEAAQRDKEKDGRNLAIKVYKVSGLTDQAVREESGANSLIRVITKTIEPGSWSELGGSGSIEYLPATGSLVVRQTAEIQKQVQALLDDLRKSAKADDARKVGKVTFPDGRDHDFGTVKPGRPLKHVFRVVNASSDTPVRITSVHVSCGCLTGSMNKRGLEPNEEGKLEVTVDSSRFAGRKSMLLFLEMQQGSRKESVKFSIAANVVEM